MKRMNFFARLDANPPPHSLCGKGFNDVWRKKAPFYVMLLVKRTTSDYIILEEGLQW